MATLLVVDDVEVVRAVLARMLKKAGHDVIEADSVSAARKILKAHTCGAIITDLWMPGEDGVSFIESIRASKSTIPIIAVTGGAPRSPVEFSIDAAAKAGADQVLVKPVAKQELLDAVATAIRPGFVSDASANARG